MSLSVSAIGPETIVYKWKKDGADIIQSDRYCTGVNEPTLTISSFKIEDMGSYTCEIKTNNDAVSVESNPAQLELSK